MQVHVLLADDSLDLRLIVGLALERAGYRVSQSIDGDQALAMLVELVPDVALLDVVMPGLDGLSVCRAARLQPGLEHVRIVVMSGSLAEEEAMEAGADHFISKPFPGRHLISLIERLLQMPPRRTSGPLPADAR